MKKVLGMGAALVDILANVDDAWIEAQGVQKGGMNMVDWPQMEKFLGALKNPLRVPGGRTFSPRWQGSLYFEDWRR